MVFSGMYPTNAEDFEDLRSSIEKLQLNDSSLIYEPETSTALGFGFRCGFLGLLHMEIVQERLEREYNQNIINTVPNVEYRVTKTNGEVVLVDNPSYMPPLGDIEKVEEPFIKAQIIVPDRVCRQHHEALHGPAGRLQEHDISRPDARGHHL